jgi:hypothetical protein
VGRPSGTRDQFFFLLETSFRQLRACYFVAPSLTRGRVCNLLYNCCWALPSQPRSGLSPAELTTIFYSLIWDSPNLESQVPVFISSRNRVAQLYPRALGSLLSPLATRRATVEVFWPACTRVRFSSVREMPLANGLLCFFFYYMLITTQLFLHMHISRPPQACNCPHQVAQQHILCLGDEGSVTDAALPGYRDISQPAKNGIT